MYLLVTLHIPHHRGYMADQISNKPLETKEDANYFNAADINKYPLTEYATMLDSFNCDLNLKIDSDWLLFQWQWVQIINFTYHWSVTRLNLSLNPQDSVSVGLEWELTMG